MRAHIASVMVVALGLGCTIGLMDAFGLQPVHGLASSGQKRRPSTQPRPGRRDDMGTATNRKAARPVLLQNTRLALSFDRATGALTALRNKLSGETYCITGDTFAIEAEGLRVDLASARLLSLKAEREAVVATYEGAGVRVVVRTTLRGDHHFAQRHVTLTFARDARLKRVVLGRPAFSAPHLQMVCYRYPRFMRPPGAEPCRTFFGRTPKGGFFTGVALPFDASALEGEQITLAYAPSLRVKAGETFACEPVYLGVYRRRARDGAGARELQALLSEAGGPYQVLRGSVADPKELVLPLRSESDAMVAMASALLGPPRHGLVPMACAWHCEMQQYTYTPEAVEGDMRSLDVIAECGIDWVSDSHPWGGETAKMNALGPDDHYAPGEMVRRWLEHARQVGVKVVMWPTMNHTHPWWGEGRPFRADKPDWLLRSASPESKPGIIKAAKANCFANTPFLEWLGRINREGMASGYYPGWAMDGSFFGDGGWYTSIIPVDCASDEHDHLPGDSNYACQRALNRLTATVRERHPEACIFYCRPPMDLGVWSLWNADICFTLLEMGTDPSNLVAGDEIRRWSRVRVHHDFFPHYVDQPLLFPSRADRNTPPNWPRGHLDYILLSALSSSPNQLFYLPTKTGLPAEDKAEIRKWLDWGRANIAYLKVRKDLPGWPAPGKADGSAHIVGDRGLVFLFNSGKEPLAGEFTLNEESIGLQGKGAFTITQEHPESERSVTARYGEDVCWQVPPETAVVLRVTPAR